jgi:hypothetical protein
VSTVRHTILSVVHRNLEPLSPQLLTIKVLVDYFGCSIFKVLAVEWHAYEEETRTKNWLSFRELDLALVGAICHADFVQVGDKPIKGMWRACDDESTRAIVERYIDLRVVGKILVCLRNVGLKVF